jgi:AraC-like DNA-binding protein
LFLLEEITVSVTTRWEERPEIRAQAPKIIDDFKNAYNDHSLTLKLIAANFGMSTDTVHPIAIRLGCPSRPVKTYSKTKLSPVVSATLIDEEIEKARAQLIALEQKKVELEMRVERQGDYIRVFGLDCDILVEATRWARWLKAGGPQRVRQLIREGEWG